MTVSAPHRFISAAAAGENWREIARDVADQIKLGQPDQFKPNIGFLYITENLAADAAGILALLKSVTGITEWSGCIARGVCANGVEYFGRPAISLMIGTMKPDDFHAFHAAAPNFKAMHHDLKPWLNRHDPVLALLHADPRAEAHPAQAIEEIETVAGAFMVGGLTSFSENAIITRDGMARGIGGFIFSQNVAVSTALSQGCIPMGPMREISSIDVHVIDALDGLKPFEAFSGDMKDMAEKRIDFKPSDILNAGKDGLPQNLVGLLNGEAHVAFPVPGSDQNDFLVRNIAAFDPENGLLAVAEKVEDGQKMMFVYRDDETVRADLAHTLVNLRKRIIHEKGDFVPRGALYVSCVARAGVSFQDAGIESARQPGGEMALLKEILGDIPIAGFYANGEISNNRLYGYTGVLTVFL